MEPSETTATRFPATRFSADLKRSAVIMAIFLPVLAAHPASATEECNVGTIAEMVKAISLLRQVENSLNFLALSQADAIVDIATGVHTLELYNHESGFYGPLGGLRKATDKTESMLHDFDKSIRRLAMFATIEPQYEDMRESTARIVAAGYDVHRELEAGDPAAATRIYAAATVVALGDARADAYTAMSTLERSISRSGLRCK